VSERTRRVRHSPVADAVALLPIEPLLVHRADDPVTVMRLATEQPQTRLLGVVDDAGVLVGVLSAVRLAEAVIASVSPETLLADIADADDAARFGHAIAARSIGDVMLPPATVTPTATVDDAFRTMHRRHLTGVYVIDEAGRPTGYLDLLELTLCYIEALEADRAELPGVPPPTA
jgi:CBS domain-containing protein